MNDRRCKRRETIDSVNTEKVSFLLRASPRPKQRKWWGGSHPIVTPTRFPPPPLIHPGPSFSNVMTDRSWLLPSNDASRLNDSGNSGVQRRPPRIGCWTGCFGDCFPPSTFHTSATILKNTGNRGVPFCLRTSSHLFAPLHSSPPTRRPPIRRFTDSPTHRLTDSPTTAQPGKTAEITGLVGTAYRPTPPVQRRKNSTLTQLNNSEKRSCNCGTIL